jgi:Flp pilus assembly CpaF family ATPase
MLCDAMLEIQGAIATALFANSTLVRPESLGWLREMAAAGKNILVCGPTGSGKTLLLRELAQQLSPDKLVAVIEEYEELFLDRVLPDVATFCPPSFVSAESRRFMADVHGLTRAALRFRPDVVIVGEVKGSEATILLKIAQQTQILTTLHNTDGDPLDRFVELVTGDLLIPSEDIDPELKNYVNQVFDIIVRLEHGGEGGDTRQVADIRVVGNPGALRNPHPAVMA